MGKFKACKCSKFGVNHRNVFVIFWCLSCAAFDIFSAGSTWIYQDIDGELIFRDRQNKCICALDWESFWHWTSSDQRLSDVCNWISVTRYELHAQHLFRLYNVDKIISLIITRGKPVLLGRHICHPASIYKFEKRIRIAGMVHEK